MALPTWIMMAGLARIRAALDSGSDSSARRPARKLAAMRKSLTDRGRSMPAAAARSRSGWWLGFRCWESKPNTLGCC